MMNSILIVDDEPSIVHNLEAFFKAKGFVTHVAFNGKNAVSVCKSNPINLVLLDLYLPDMDGLAVLKEIKVHSSRTGVIIFSGRGDVSLAVKAMQMKADNFIQKPVDLEVLEAITYKTLDAYRVQSELVSLQRKVSQLESMDRFRLLRLPDHLYSMIRILARNASTQVLILGETGTGKGMVAQTIHELSQRRHRPYVDINCSGLKSEFLESELFGHEQGAFTDAKNAKKGLLEIADGGSLLLDEAGELALPVQSQLLKAIETKTFRRLGGTANISVDVRIIAATHTNLEEAVKKKSFREDLYYRLNVMPIFLPPLRERRDDILPLAHEFLDEFKIQVSKNIQGISSEAEGILLYYSWPGNIRELKNVIERAVLLCEGDTLQPAQLGEISKKVEPKQNMDGTLEGSLASIEKRSIEKALIDCNHNHTHAAKILGIHRTTLLKKIKRYFNG